MSTYEPGTYVTAQIDGADVRLVRDDEGMWVHAERTRGRYFYADHVVTDVRPLVVLDLERYVTRELLVTWLRQNPVCGSYSVSSEIADQIEAQTKPKLQEPGIGGVVKAACVHGGTVKTWVRVGPVWYVADEPKNPDDWDSLVDPVLVREGVQS